MKTELRLRAKELRKTLNMAEISAGLVDLVKDHPFYVSAKNVMLFYPTANEVDLRALLLDDKSFYLPRVNGKDLEICPYKHKDELKLSSYKIMEPVSKSVNAEVLDLIIVPALMADNKGYRLGYGGGFYDRFLKNVRAKTLCALPKELVVSNLVHDTYDIAVDFVLTF